MATDRKFEPDIGDVQQPLDPQNLRAETDKNQDAPPVSEILRGWPAVAYDLSPRYVWALTGVFQEAVHTGVHSKDQIEQIIRRYCLDCPLPWEVFEEISTSITRYFHLVTKHKVSIEAFLQSLSPGRRPKVVYEVFHHGRPHIYCDELPPAILNLRDSVLFWIDHSKNEWQSGGQPLGRGERLEPKTEEMLCSLCLADNAGHEIPLLDLYTSVWAPAVLPSIKVVRNNISVHQNKINTFAAEKFIIKVPTDPKSIERKVLHLRGQDAYRIGKQASEELCIIRSFGR